MSGAGLLERGAGLCVIDDADTVIWRGRTASTGEAIGAALKAHAPNAARIGLESGQLAVWLFHQLKSGGFPSSASMPDMRRLHYRSKSTKPTPTTRGGAARIMRVGWYREVSVKEFDCYAMRVLLVARAQLVSQITALKNCVRGILKTFGLTLPKGLRSQFALRVRHAIEDHSWRRTIKQYGNGRAKAKLPAN